MKLAAVYMRMSTDKQEYSIDSQWRLLSDWASRNDYQIIKRYQDAGISAMESKLDKRTDFLKMIEDSEQSEWRTVLIYDSSRFSRSLKDSIVYKSILKQNGVQLISITEPVLDEDVSLMVDALNGATNELYIRKLSKNVKRGLEQKALRGEIISQVPYGYRRSADKKKIESIPEEANIVTYIYDQYIAGKSSYILAMELSRAGVKTHNGNLFDTRQVNRILTNPVYYGTVVSRVNGKEYQVENAHPGIVLKEKFEAAKAVTESRASRVAPKIRPKEIHKHWLAGIVRCGKCGGCYYRRANSGRGNRSPQFLCINYMHGQCSSPPVVAEHILEDLFFNAANVFLETEDAYAEKQIVHVKSPVTTDFDALIAKAERTLKRAREAYLAEIDSLEDYKSTKIRLEAEIEDLKQQKQRQENPVINVQKVKDNVRGMIKMLKDPSVELIEKCKVSERIIRNVTIYPDRTVSVIFFDA
ncbi:MAG: recombinase family protein [Candidatus Merdivicinus sp.]